jgi:hypothetical protein
MGCEHNSISKHGSNKFMQFCFRFFFSCVLIEFRSLRRAGGFFWVGLDLLGYVFKLQIHMTNPS